MQARPLVRFRWTSEGTVVGYRHRFAADASGQVSCLMVSPLLIVVDADDHDILGNVDGRRDVTALFGEGS